MVNTSTSSTAHHSSSSSSSSSSKAAAAEKEDKEEIRTTPEHTFKEIHTALNKGNNREQILDYIVDGLSQYQANSLSDSQKAALKNTINKNLLNKLD